MKIVINNCFGGFSLSEKAYDFLGIEWDGSGGSGYYFNDNRTDKKLIECIETLKDEASGASAELKVIEIPNDVDYKIRNYDGIESIEEVHRSWS